MLEVAGSAQKIISLKYGDMHRAGWGPRLRNKFGYMTPDDRYEALVWSLVGPETDWLDVGCGREIFPSNPAAAFILADRCRSLTGLDPSDNLDENRYIHQRAKCTLETFDPPHGFDLITLRMVAEHIEAPEAAAAALARLCRPGGRVVIYTVHRWSPVSLVAALTPMGFHHRMKALLWQGEEKDTFPTVYQMNTRRRLARLMGQAGFDEENFQSLPDTRTTNRFRLLNLIELSTWRALRALGLGYPERCLMGVYRRPA